MSRPSWGRCADTGQERSRPPRQCVAEDSGWRRRENVRCSCLAQPPVEMLDKCQVVALLVLERSAHARVALAETEIIGGTRLGRLTSSPIPASSVLKVDDVE